MGYVDAAYAICLGVLALYALSLVLRRRRLERADALGADVFPREAPGSVPSGRAEPSGP